MSTILDQLGVSRMTVEERLDLIGEIWDTLPESDTGPIPDWHRLELERRLAAADADPNAGVPWDTVKARLTGGS